MEGAVLSSASNSGYQSQLQNVGSPHCARTLPKQRRCEPLSASARHHTYPRTTLPKRAEITCRLEPLAGDLHKASSSTPENQPSSPFGINSEDMPAKPNGTIKLKGTLGREVANAWKSRVGAPDEPAPADRVQSLFNDIELYPTKTQVFEMLVCARQCARRKSLTLTFGEFCVFAAELRRCSRQARQTPSKQESPQWSTDKDVMCKHINGSEASPAPCEVFLGGSCNPTTWRSEIAIPMLKKMGITYFNPQVEDWSTELVEVEHRAKAAARALLFVLDSETRAVAASVEAAHLAAAPRDLLLVLRPYTRHQTIGRETISDHEYIELSRARNTLQEAVERRGLPAFTDIPAALRCARAVLRGARTHPRQPLGQTILRLKRAFDAAGGRGARLQRAKALEALTNVTQAARDVVDRSLPPSVEHVDFEHFCAAVAEIAADGGCTMVAEQAGAGVGEGAACGGVAGRLRRALRSLRDRLAPHAPESPRNGRDGVSGEGAGGTRADAAAAAARDANGFHAYNARLRAYGKKLRLDIPKNNSARSDGSGTAPAPAPATAASDGSDDAVFTPGTERRLERLPAMLGAPTHDVYLGGVFPSSGPRPEEILRRAGLTYTVPRANDYSRMFSAPARRSAPAHPESPRTDKKPRPSLDVEDDVQLRDRSGTIEPSDRLSASDFYSVTEDVTPQPFKGTYDEDLLLGSRVLVFAACAEAPAFASMVLAAHYMGLRPRHTVLLVQPMDPHHDHMYSEAAVKDYNRGRHYLTDLARRSGVPVTDSTEAAMAAAAAIAATAAAAPTS